jgi:glycerol kinase
MAETTALGAAMAAGSAEGIGVWDLQRENPDSVISDAFQPSISEDGKKSGYFIPIKGGKNNFGQLPKLFSEIC